MSDQKDPQDDQAAGAQPAERTRPERIYFMFGKDQTPEQIAETINEALGLK